MRPGVAAAFAVALLALAGCAGAGAAEDGDHAGGGLDRAAVGDHILMQSLVDGGMLAPEGLEILWKTHNWKRRSPPPARLCRGCTTSCSAS